MRNKELQNKILHWFGNNKRHLPWRKTTDPYRILISEVMLQQTQVDRVIPFYIRFLKKYPTVEILAKARTRTLLKVWSGLGYNSRALRLRETARFLVEKNQGKIPMREEALLNLPGIGPYTAAAIMAFAYNRPAAVIDTNIRRVLIHELHLPETTTVEELRTIALHLVPEGKSRLWHNALMDYGAMKATARKTGIKSLSLQSRFDGSVRQLRGRIVKTLLRNGKIRLSSLRNQFQHPHFQRVLEKLKQEDLIISQNGFIRIIP